MAGQPLQGGAAVSVAVAVESVLHASALPARESRALLCHILGVSRERLVAHPEDLVPADALERFRAAAAQRAAGMPMAYLTGEQEFYGHRFAVTPDVLVPRPETELLVDTALAVLHGRPAARVLELGTGSGCIAIALQRMRPDLFIVATDRSLPALRLARANSLRLEAGVHFVAGDWLAPLQGCFDLIVSNPPYVAAADAHLTALAFEPRAALTDGADGLQALSAIAVGAGRLLSPGGALLLEHGYDQAEAVRALLASSGMTAVRTLRDLAGHERICWGSKPADS